jgi:hypothetical protein
MDHEIVACKARTSEASRLSAKRREHFLTSAAETRHMLATTLTTIEQSRELLTRLSLAARAGDHAG